MTRMTGEIHGWSAMRKMISICWSLVQDYRDQRQDRQEELLNSHLKTWKTGSLKEISGHRISILCMRCQTYLRLVTGGIILWQNTVTEVKWYTVWARVWKVHGSHRKMMHLTADLIMQDVLLNWTDRESSLAGLLPRIRMMMTITSSGQEHLWHMRFTREKMELLV